MKLKVKRGIYTYKGDNSKFIFARITGMPLFGLGIFGEKAATTKIWYQHAVLLLEKSTWYYYSPSVLVSSKTLTF